MGERNSSFRRLSEVCGRAELLALDGRGTFASLFNCEVGVRNDRTDGVFLNDVTFSLRLEGRMGTILERGLCNKISFLQELGTISDELRLNGIAANPPLLDGAYSKTN